MIVLAASAFLGLALMSITIYCSYRIFGDEKSVWTKKGILGTWIPLMFGVLVAVSPISYLTYDGYRVRGEHQEAVTAFLESHPETEQVVRAEKGETWLFSYMNGGALHTVLRIGENYLVVGGAEPEPESD